MNNYLQQELNALITEDSKIIRFLQAIAVDGLWYRDLENPENEWMDDRFWQTLGYNPDEMANQSDVWKHILNQEDIDITKAQLKLYLNDPNLPYTHELSFLHKQGHTVWIRCKGLIITDANEKPTRFLGVHQDITELKNAQQENERLLLLKNAKSERLINFSHIVSHNLRSHSNSLSMLIKLMERKHVECTENDVFKILKVSTENLSETVKHLNEIAAMNLPTAEKISTHEINSFITRSIVNITPSLVDGGGKITRSKDSDLTAQLIPTYMDGILLNLLTNAIKYRSLDRALEIHIDAFREKEYVVIAISDNGLGIDLKKHGHKMFGMYKVFHEHKEARGIGLFISKSQIEAMHGQIKVESEVNKGSTFKIYLRHDPI